MDASTALQQVSAEKGLNFRPFQARAIHAFFEKMDTFVAVPTGSGKTFCYCFLAIIWKLVYPTADDIPLLLILSPLVALMEDQVSQLGKLGIPATHLKNTSDQITSCTEVLFLSPEFATRNLRKILRKYKKRVIGVVVDEAHCIPAWGNNFRPAFKEIGGLRAIIPTVPLMALTATATDSIKKAIISSLYMTKLITIHILPDRPNLFFNVISLAGTPVKNLYVFDSLIKSINDPSRQAPKTLIYCSTIDTVALVYSYFHCRVPNPGTPLSPIAMFHKGTASLNKAHVLSELPKPESVVRVVICTVAFGLGVNICDIREVVNFGVPLSINDFVQESGRAGRDGDNAVSTLYNIKSLKRHDTDAAIVKYTSRDIPCRRKFLAQHFQLTDYEKFEAPQVKQTPRCCDLCKPI